jgi:HK97 family phage portal protein
MGLRSWLLRPLAGDTTGDWFVAFKDALEANRSLSGVSVTQETAMGLPAVYRCQSINADVVSTTPLGVFQRDGKNRVAYPKPRWLENPNDNMDEVGFVGQIQASLEADGNGFALKAVTSGGQLAGLFPLNPQCVRVERDANGRRVYFVKQYGGEEATVYANEMFHVQGFTPPGALRGISPIAALKQAIGLGLAAQQFGAQYFGSGATMTGVITMDKSLNPEQTDKLKEDFTRKHGGLSKSHAIGILTGGAQFTQLSVSPEESQFLETRKFNAVEIACAYGVPAWFVTEAEGAKGFVTGLYATMYMWLLTGINVRFVRLESALSALFPPRSAYVKFNRKAFLAMDPTERAEFYSKALIGRYMVPNECRGLEDMDPLPGGDDPLWSVQWQTENTIPAGGVL